MAKIQQQVLRLDLLSAAKLLPEVRDQHGRASADYQKALKRVARLWAVLRMTRRNEEFMHEVT